MRIGVRKLRGDGEGHGGLANSAGTDDGDKTPPNQLT